MKINELKAGEIYRPNNYGWTHNIYRINDNRLEYKFEEEDWEKSTLTYNELLTYEFEELSKEIEWNKVPKFTKVQVKDEDYENWINAYFLDKDGSIFYVTLCDEFTYDSREDLGLWKCRLDESVEIKPEWYKEYYCN